MTHPALQELLAPPLAAESRSPHRGLEDMAEALLQRFRQEAQADPVAFPSTGAVDAVTPEAEDALYAWGVTCYSQQQYADASALFAAARRRGATSWRLDRALGAALLAQRDAGGAAEAFARASQRDPADAEVVFHWAQAEAMRSHWAKARELVRAARSLAQSTGSQWPALLSWCDELTMHLEPVQSPET